MRANARTSRRSFNVSRSTIRRLVRRVNSFGNAHRHQPQPSPSAFAERGVQRRVQFNLWNADGRIRVYRRRHERYVDKWVVQNNPYRWGGVMVGKLKTQLVCQGNLTARRYIDQVLHPAVVPIFRQRQNLVYQHYNVRPHITRVTRDFLQAKSLAFCLGRRVHRIATQLNTCAITLDVGYVDVNPSQQTHSMKILRPVYFYVFLTEFLLDSFFLINNIQFCRLVKISFCNSKSWILKNRTTTRNVAFLCII